MLFNQTMKLTGLLLVLAAALLWLARKNRQTADPAADQNQAASVVGAHLGLMEARRGGLRKEEGILHRERLAASRMHTRFAALELSPVNSKILSNMVLGAVASRLAKLERFSDLEILEFERRDIAESDVFTDAAGQAFREVLAMHGLTGSRTDHLHRLIMEINAIWHAHAPEPFQEVQEFNAEVNAILREAHHRRAADEERLRSGFLALAKEEFTGLNVDVDALFEDILALPPPEDLPGFPWPFNPP